MKNLTKGFLVFLSQAIFVYLVWGVFYNINKDSLIVFVPITLVWILLSLLYGYFGYKASVLENSKISGGILVLTSFITTVFMIYAWLLQT
ncbi:MAG: hypothetical protein WC027_01235 [Candidatus Paceibacterota bacterium]